MTRAKVVVCVTRNDSGYGYVTHNDSGYGYVTHNNSGYGSRVCDL